MSTIFIKFIPILLLKSLFSAALMGSLAIGFQSLLFQLFSLVLKRGGYYLTPLLISTSEAGGEEEELQN